MSRIPIRYRLRILLLVPAVGAGLACRFSSDEETLLSLAVADNSRCHVCHLNFEDEKLAISHGRANVGCEKCHGDSTPHCEDEGNVAPPDILFAKAEVNPSCLACHPWRPGDDQKPALAASDSHQYCRDCHGGQPDVMPSVAELPHRYCTDCHGEHRLAQRSSAGGEASHSSSQE